MLSRKKHVVFDDVNGLTIQSDLVLDLYAPLRFLAKVALGYGYFLYGEDFCSALDCNALRDLTKLKSNGLKSNLNLSNTGIKLCDRFSSDCRPGGPGHLDKVLAENWKRSIVVSIPHENSISFLVGILGQYLGTIIIPCNSDIFPRDGEHDLGHAMRMSPGAAERLSYRELIIELDLDLGERNKLSKGPEQGA